MKRLSHIKSFSLFVSILFILSACGQPGEQSGSTTTNNSGIAMPFAVSALPNPSDLHPTLVCPNGKPVAMSIDNDTLHGSCSGLSPGANQKFTINLSYGTDYLMLASASKTIDVVDGSTVLSFQASDYDSNRYDEDGDGKSNLFEIINNLDPYTFNSDPVVNFSQVKQNVTEKAGTISLTVSLDQASISSDITVNYTVSGNATGGGVDYTLADTSGKVTIVKGNTSATIDITIVNDTKYETPDEDIVFTLDSVTNATLGTTNIDTVTIADETYNLGGTITGLKSGAVLTLYNNGINKTTVTGNSGTQSFSFMEPVDADNTYQVTSLLPASANQICGVGSGKGGPISADTNTVTVTCVANAGKKIDGFFSSFFIRPDGTLWAWGDGETGGLGDGTTVQQNAPEQIGTDTHWAVIAAGMGHTVALKTDGTLWAWGYNYYGQLGNGDTTRADQYAPIQIGTATDWINIAAGTNHSVGLRKNGNEVTLWTWGRNQYGQLGDGNDPTSEPFVTEPQQIGVATNWASIDSSSYHNVALQSDGSLWTWGDNAYGELGDGNDPNAPTNPELYVNVPQRIGAATDQWVNISAAGHNTVALRNDSGTLKLFAWGDNADGQIGDGSDPATVPYVTVPTLVPLPANASSWVRVESGATTTFALAKGLNGNDVTLWAWGDNSAGQLGDAFFELTVNTPKQVGIFVNWKQVMSGRAGTIIAQQADTNGTLSAWGANTFGSIGDGTAGKGQDKYSPVNIGTSTSFKYHTIGGTVSGLDVNNNQTVTISNYDLVNDIPLVISANGSFVFPVGYTANTSYDVYIGLQPSTQTCDIKNGLSTGVDHNVWDITVTCN